MLERYYHELLNFISRTTGDRHAAADVVQETFARVLASQSRPANAAEQAIAEPRALLYRTARNIVIDQYRRESVRGHDTLDDDEMTAPESDQPEARLASRQIAKALLNVIDSLPPRCREAFVLYKFEGLSQGEIAERMGISRNMVEKHVIAGMVACKRCLDTIGTTMG